MAKFFMDLHLLEGGAGAGAAPAAGGEGGDTAAVTPGVLEDGTQVDTRLAARMEAQAKRRAARGEAVPTHAAPQKQAEAQKGQPAQPAQPQAEQFQQKPAAPSLDEEWSEAKKGKFKDQWSRDVQAAIQDRFKNQRDANETLAKLQPALNALAKQRGINEGDLDGLINSIVDDDSLYEEAAEEAGMTVEGYKLYQKMEAENARLKAQEQAEQQNMFFRQHLQGLARQAEELKQIYPDFNLMEELKNETFRRLTAPNSGLSVKDAFYAIHHDQLEPQAMAYGIQRATQQISQTLQANRSRPTEGALQKGAQASDIAIDARSMTREQRQQLIERARRGEKIVL